MEAANAMTDRSQGPSPTPTSERMIKEETVKEDGRTLIYYTFPDDQDALMLPAAQEAAYV